MDVCGERGPVPDKSLVDLLNSAQHGDVVEAVEAMQKTAFGSSFPDEHLSQL